MPQLTVNGASLNYLQVGQGPDVLLVHAVTSNLSVWLFIGLVDKLVRDGFRVTAYDLRGHGLSEATPTGYTSAAMAEDLHQLHAAIGLGPAYLVGHSFGAVVSVHAAVLHPERVAGLILADPYFPGLAHIEPNLGRSNVWVDLRETFRDVGLDLGEEVDFTALFRIVEGLTPEQWTKIRERMGPASGRWLAQLPRLAQTTCGADVFAVAGLTEERIVSLRQPVVALYDEHSPFLATCRYLREHLADCTVEILPEARHLGPVQNPAVFVELVRKHLGRWRRRSICEAADSLLLFCLTILHVPTVSFHQVLLENVNPFLTGAQHPGMDAGLKSLLDLREDRRIFHDHLARHLDHDHRQDLADHPRPRVLRRAAQGKDPHMMPRRGGRRRHD